jgi:poly-gamma-glutamate synthesis protein (capsule biosynthesis protein)
VAPLLRGGDVVIGHNEIPYTRRAVRTTNIQSAEDPDAMEALAHAGFNVMTMAGNHLWDAGVPGIEDTLAWLRGRGIASSGAGMNLKEAREPALVEKAGIVFGVLSFNCVGPKETWATHDKPGGAYVHVLTHYELDHAVPGGTPNVYTFAEPESLDAMVEDISKARSRCDVLVVALHKGIIHTRAKLARYERDVSRAAIDAGADLVLGHHAHILKGIEAYKGKTIFHGLNNLVTILPSLAPKPGEAPASWSRKRRELYNFDPDPANPTYPFHPESKMTVIAKVLVEEKRVRRVSCVPCIVNQEGAPEIAKGERAVKVCDYLRDITREAKLNAQLALEDDEIVIN